MKLRLLALLAAFAALVTAVRAADEVRFTKSLGTAEFTDLGLTRLSSDQIASLDALVRRDLARADLVTKTPRPARFSERLAASERDSAGLNLLAPAELVALDAAVQRLAPPPRESFIVADYSTGSDTVPYLKINRAPEIHGEVMLQVGAGSHGYTEYGGGIALELDDPQHNLALAIAYSEFHTKGGVGWLRRGCREGFTDFRNLDLGLELGK
jgi:hypothetical protein